MAKKEILYHGKNEEELKKMSIKEFSQLIPSNVRRKINRGFTEGEKHLIEKIKKKDNVKTHCRDMVILPEMLGKTIIVYSGKNWDKVTITLEMLGHRLGEFSLSRRKVAHSAPGVGATKSSASSSVK